MTRTLLIEVGVEELPSSFVARALEQMPAKVIEGLAAHRLSHGEVRALGTPRRLAVLVEAVAEKQADLEERVLGPPRAAAYDADGAPTPALLGFTKKLGIPVDAVEVVRTERGEYVAAMRREKGRAALEVLPAVVHASVRIDFPKTMRWGRGEFAFGRPVHWLVALFGTEMIDAKFAGVTADRRTRGHRFLAPAPIELQRAEDYVDALREAHVLVDPGERRAVMERALEATARNVGGEWVRDEPLLDDNLSLVEEPHVLCGRFDERFLDLPAEVIVAVMRGHQRYFAVRGPNGALLPRYLAVANTARDPETVVRGNDRVLRARLADARFFVEEDRKKTLAERVPKLDGIVFQGKLGTVGDKVRRVGELARAASGLDEAVALAPLTKADLVSLVVGEFPELQGVMGRIYALAEGMDARMADAIRDHYLPRSASDVVPHDRLAAALAVADRLDTLVGCVGVGIAPTGSADPFGLRRAVLAVIRIALEGPLDVDVQSLTALAYAAYVERGVALESLESVRGKIDDLFRGRLRSYFEERFDADVIEACLSAWRGDSIRDVGARVHAIAAARGEAGLASLLIAFKRAHNIAKDGPPGEVAPELFEQDAERGLYAALGAVRERLDRHAAEGRYAEAIRLVADELRAPIDRFFEQVFVHVDDPVLRDNRLRLLASVAQTLGRIAHFHLLSG